tara:strand:+ start:1410 stop:1604 length:195 start_codon:yes stop_codon:yes gene_type:complete
MSSDKQNNVIWKVTRKVEGRTEYLISPTSWDLDPRFAKYFDTQRGAKAFLKENELTGSVKRHEL